MALRALINVATQPCLLAHPPQPLSGKTVTLSNTALPLDTDGNLILTGELSVIQYEGAFYVYMNDWGGCPGVNCCPTSAGCASCCFTAPPFKDPCVYTSNHTVLVYRTPDFQTWEFMGAALSTLNRKNGTEFRPQVVFNGTSFVMWYEDRWSGQTGYAVAVSASPTGPFKTLRDTVKMSGPGRIGDYDSACIARSVCKGAAALTFLTAANAVFVDDDGKAYHVRTGIVVEELTPDSAERRRRRRMAERLATRD